MSISLEKLDIVNNETIIEGIFDTIDRNSEQIENEINSISSDVANLKTGSAIKTELNIIIAEAESKISEIQTNIDNSSINLAYYNVIDFEETFLSTDWTLISSSDTDYIEGLTLYKLIVAHTLNTTVIKNYHCYNTDNEKIYCIVEPIDVASIKIISSEAFNGTIVLTS